MKAKKLENRELRILITRCCELHNDEGCPYHCFLSGDYGDSRTCSHPVYAATDNGYGFRDIKDDDFKNRWSFGDVDRLPFPYWCPFKMPVLDEDGFIRSAVLKCETSTIETHCKRLIKEFRKDFDDIALLGAIYYEVVGVIDMCFVQARMQIKKDRKQRERDATGSVPGS